jgi:hypothetical protein
MFFKNKSKYFHVVILFCLSIVLFFTSCNPKTNPPEISQESSPVIENVITVFEYLSLPIWEKEQEAFTLLLSAGDVENMEELKLLYLDVVKLFGDVSSTLGKLKISTELEKVNTLQLEICQLYIDSLNNYIKKADPIVLNDLKLADQKMKEFISEIKKAKQL